MAAARMVNGGGGSAHTSNGGAYANGGGGVIVTGATYFPAYPGGTPVGDYNPHPTPNNPTEGWLELFLTPSEKYTFSQWKEVVADQSLVHSWTRPLFQYMAKKLPSTLAPNVITFTGFLILAHCWYLTNTYGPLYPRACTWLGIINILFFFVTNRVAGYHADLLRQHTSLSDLFQYASDMGSTVWLALLLTYCWLDLNKLTFVETQWYAVQSTQLVLFLKHLSAYKRKDGLRYRVAAGPGEVLMAMLILLCVPAIFGKENIKRWYQQQKDTLYPIVARQLLNIEPNHPIPPPQEVATHVVMRCTYYILFATAVLQSIFLTDKSADHKKHFWTRFGLVASLMMRLVPAMLMLQTGPLPADAVSATSSTLTVTDVICDGLFMTVLTFDLCLAKMAGRELHPWVVLMSLAAVLSTPVILTLVTIYYIAVFCDLMCYLNLPLLATCRNVYCDGVYDLCHIGHKRAFQNALSLGNRLLVGVVGDADASNYKRPPIMSHAERCAEVQACKAVTQVIPNAPCFGLTQEFLDQHQIHVVAFGEEYLERYPDPKDDPYYALPRQLGIAVPLPRTQTLSTTDLIKRIQESGNLKKKSPT